MSIARHGDGLRAGVGALASQVHPVFMLPPVAASGFGAALAGEASLPPAALHAVAIFLAVYTAHIKDGYVDFYGRGEDDDHPLTERGCELALAGSTVGFGLCLIALIAAIDAWAAALTFPCWLIAYYHAPQLDTHPITVTAGYPAGIALSILGGYYVQAGSIDPVAAAFALVFLVLLSGVKVVDDEQDYAYDRSIAKRTVAVALGRERARTTGYALMALGLVFVVGFVGLRVFPPSAVLAAVAFGGVAAVARRADAEIATMLLIRGAYVFLAVLLAAVWFRPLSGAL